VQVYGNIATPLEKRESKNGKTYYVFRMAENQGKDEATRTTTWYSVRAFIAEIDADLLSKGQFVKVTGRLDSEAFMKKNGEPGSALTIITGSVVPVERSERGERPAQAEPPGQDGGASRQPKAPRTAPAPRSAPRAPAYDPIGDDDIPF
jgi:single-stranded DNA-binding protein